MRIEKIIFFLFLFSCVTPFEKVDRMYICGDHPCKNNKEIQEYFDNNISIEVYSIDTDKNKTDKFDLAELNLLEDKLKSKDKILVSEKKNEIKQKVKERKRLAKLKIKQIEDPKQIEKIVKSQESVKKKKKSKITFIRICKNLEECDIDKISKLIMDMGKERDFPDIAN
tara:strand:+ start:860 stop:1366 length:507 start_codon:yes stop_codon:yes gene_type:complete